MTQPFPDLPNIVTPPGSFGPKPPQMGIPRAPAPSPQAPVPAAAAVAVATAPSAEQIRQARLDREQAFYERQRSARRRSRWSAFFVVLGCFVLLWGVLGAWLNFTVTSSASYVERVAPMTTSDTVIESARTVLMKTYQPRIDAQIQTQNANAQLYGTTIDQAAFDAALSEAVSNQVPSAVFQAEWDKAQAGLWAGHQIDVPEGQEPLAAAHQLSVSLTPIWPLVEQELTSKGFTFKPPYTFDGPIYTVSSAGAMIPGKGALNFVTEIWWLLIAGALVLFGVAYFISRRRVALTAILGVDLILVSAVLFIVNGLLRNMAGEDAASDTDAVVLRQMYDLVSAPLQTAIASLTVIGLALLALAGLAMAAKAVRRSRVDSMQESDAPTEAFWDPSTPQVNA